ncbi:MAG: transglutaminase family protein [Magnetococcales bacterium]|nr:transglutaminase family protein [Magnetococcales bacterium]
MDYRIIHTTRYRYGEPVTIGHNRVHLRPLDLPWQRCRRFELDVRPRPATLNTFTDFFGNGVDYFEILESHRELVIKSSSFVTRLPPILPNPDATPAWESGRQGQSGEGGDVRRQSIFALESPMVARSPELADFARPDFPPERPLVAAALALTQRIHREFRYQPGSTTVATHIDQVLEQRCGVCQDFAHLAIGALRSLGLCARYISGYLETDPPPGMARLEGADASHAWFAVLVPGVGWVDFDPTNGIIPAQRHITVAVGRDYTDVPPVKGVVLGGREHVLSVAVDVLRLPTPETP